MILNVQGATAAANNVGVMSDMYYHLKGYEISNAQ